MNHILKCWPGFFDAVDSGDKTFEVRLDDRGFKVGDRLTLRRWQPCSEIKDGGHYVQRNDLHANVREDGTWSAKPTIAEIRVLITYKMPGGRFGLAPEFCVLGFVREEVANA